MGTVFQVPWTRVAPWPGAMQDLQRAGLTVLSLALGADALDLAELAAAPPERLALVLGTEGDGLARRTLADADVVVRIPMAGGVDPLNVAAAGAVAASRCVCPAEPTPPHRRTADVVAHPAADLEALPDRIEVSPLP